MSKKQWMALTWMLLAVLAIGALAGCGKTQEPAAEPSSGDGVPGGGEGLDPVSELALGMLELEGTGDAITPAQAAEMLPLWQVVAAGSLKGQAETEAVIQQIEAKLSDAQRGVIDGMALTGQDMIAWMREQGIDVPERTGGQGEGGGALQNMTEEERTKLRQEFQSMTPEQRATRMAEMGFQRPEGAPEGGSGGGAAGNPGGAPGGRGRIGNPGSVLLGSVIELLSERATG